MEIIRILVGMDVHKRSVYITEMEENGNVKEQYEIVNNESAWTEFMERYLSTEPEISLEVSTSGKYVAMKLMNMGFSIHMADPSKLSLIFNTEKKNKSKENSGNWNERNSTKEVKDHKKRLFEYSFSNITRL